MGGVKQALGNPSGDKTEVGTTQRSVDLAKGKNVKAPRSRVPNVPSVEQGWRDYAKSLTVTNGTIEQKKAKGKTPASRDKYWTDVESPYEKNDDRTKIGDAVSKKQEKLEKEFEDEERRRQSAVIDRNIDDNIMSPDLPFSNPIINPIGKLAANLMYDTYRAATMVSSFLPGQEMDYKHKNKKYQDFGNRNYGAVGTARGFSPETLKRAAGLVQEFMGAYDPSFGHAWGDFPYGDDPADQKQTDIGIRQAQDRLKKK